MEFTNVRPATRKVMQGNKGQGTKPEMTVRRLVHGLGYRYRLHQKGLPGTPDLVFGRRRKVVFVHGCFWHAHGCKVGGRGVSARDGFWTAKFARNQERDVRVQAQLAASGWEVLVVWECETSDQVMLAKRLIDFLGEAPEGATTNQNVT